MKRTVKFSSLYEHRNKSMKEAIWLHWNEEKETKKGRKRRGFFADARERTKRG